MEEHLGNYSYPNDSQFLLKHLNYLFWLARKYHLANRKQRIQLMFLELVYKVIAHIDINIKILT